MFFFLTNSYGPSYILSNICGMNDGKRVQIPRGPAAVTEDELRESHCPKTVFREKSEVSEDTSPSFLVSPVAVFGMGRRG